MLKKIIIRLALTLTFLSILISCGEKGVKPHSKKDTMILVPSKVNLGTIQGTELKTLRFEIVNKSQKDLKIVAKAKSCGCTDFDVPSDIVKANSRMKVRVSFDPSKVAGKFEKSVFMRLANGKILVFRFFGKVVKTS